MADRGPSAPQLSDEELYEKLRDEFDYRCPGPITDSTRSVYQKKLIALTKERHKVANKRLSTIQALDADLDLDARNKRESTPPSAIDRSALTGSPVRRSPRRSTNARMSMAAGASSLVSNHENGAGSRMSAVHEEEQPPAQQNQRLAKQSTPRPPSTPTMPKAEEEDFTEFMKSSRRRTVAGGGTHEYSPSTKKATGSKQRRSIALAPPRLATYSSAESSGDDDLPMASQNRASASSASKVVTAPRLASTSKSLLNSGRVNQALIRPPLIRKSPRNTPRQNLGGIAGMPSSLASFSDSDSEVIPGDQNAQPNSNRGIRERLMRFRPFGGNEKRQQPQSGTRKSVARSALSQADDGEESANNGGGNFYSAGINHSSSTSSSQYNWISFVLLTLIILFFVTIFSYYFYARINFSLFGGSSVKSGSDLYAATTDLSSGLQVPICSGTSAADSKRFCFQNDEDARVSLIILQEIRKFVDRQVFQRLCGESDKKAFVDEDLRFTFHELKHMIISTIGPKLDEIIKDLWVSRKQTREVNVRAEMSRHLLETFSLIELNPELKMLPMKDSFADFMAIKVDPHNYQISLPLKCRVYLLALHSLPQLLATALIVAVAFLVYKYAHHRRRVAFEEEEELMDDLMEKSLELLQSPDEPGSMPVIHIRDTLLSPAERKNDKYKRLWSLVVEYIEKNESRVKVELEVIDGEDFKTWRWISLTGSPSPLASPAAKSFASPDSSWTSTTVNASAVMRTGSMEWQGKAFENVDSVEEPPQKQQQQQQQQHQQQQQLPATPEPTQRPLTSSSTNTNTTPNGSGNGFVAPTRFLKVRNMFSVESVTSSPGWKSDVMNAILEKCQPNVGEEEEEEDEQESSHGLTHMHVDASKCDEGLVYIKCNSIRSASKAFNALHGWWCERKLVSVRFLKEERYYQRFPEARHRLESMQMMVA